MSNDLSVRKSIIVEASQERAFRVFCEQISRWWPFDYHIGKQDAVDVVVEGADGGRWYEIAADGTECDWGRVIVWSPPQRVVLSWQISPEWEFDATITSEVDVRFIVEGDARTRVELEHRNLSTFGDDAETMHGIFDGESGWSGLLRRYAAAIQDQTIDN